MKYIIYIEHTFTSPINDESTWCSGISEDGIEIESHDNLETYREAKELLLDTITRMV